MPRREIEAELRRTLDDRRLSRGESRALRELVQDIKDDRDSLAFLRNLAFKIAREEIESAPVLVLDWLEEVDKIVDNATRAERREPAEVAFSPGEDALGLIMEKLDNAASSVDVCVFTLTDDRLTGAILDAHRRGVRVRVIADDDKCHDEGSDVARLAGKGVRVRVDPHPEHMHHKFALIDGRTLITGSYNWTRGATRNHENVLATEDPQVVRKYCDAFEALWKDFGGS